LFYALLKSIEAEADWLAKVLRSLEAMPEILMSLIL
jgi:hypothetical protein